jgi:hypothetical protein
MEAVGIRRRHRTPSAVRRVGEECRPSPINRTRGGDRQTYRLHVDANVPAKDFWSITLYDSISRSMLQGTGSDDVTIDSNDKLKQNKDGSYDLFVGPDESKAPKRLGELQTLQPPIQKKDLWSTSGSTVLLSHFSISLTS